MGWSVGCFAVYLKEQSCLDGFSLTCTRHPLLASSKVTEESLLWDTFEDTPECTGCSTCDDYIETDSACATPDCETPAVGGFNGCASDDDTCKKVMYQSECGALRRWAVNG